MVPTLILLGVVLGHWWRWTLPLAIVGWPVLLVVTGTPITVGELVIAAVLSLVNAGLGMLVYQLGRSIVRGRRPRTGTQPTSMATLPRE